MSGVRGCFRPFLSGQVLLSVCTPPSPFVSLCLVLQGASSEDTGEAPSKQRPLTFSSAARLTAKAGAAGGASVVGAREEYVIFVLTRKDAQ